jgi:hypothetical protein
VGVNSTTLLVTGAISTGMVPWLAAVVRSARREPAPLPRLELATIPARPTVAARATAEQVGWRQLLLAGQLAPVTPAVADPGNPGHWLVLAADPTGALGDVRVLVGIDGSPSSDGSHTVHARVVPGWLDDPYAAAAWTYDDPTHPLRTTAAVYADLAVRR